MTEREFEQMRNAYHCNGKRTEHHKSERAQSSYFAFFKLRCLVCGLLFLGMLLLDRQTDLKSNNKVQQMLHLLAQEEITTEQCFQILK